jgi:hypothetical protein
MKQRVTKELFGYWRGLKAGRSAPERNEVDFGAIRHLLADVFILRVDPLGRFPVEISGTRVNAYWLDEQKGRPFLDMWEARDRRSILDALEAVATQARPAVIEAKCSAGDYERLDLELVMLPLSEPGKPFSYALCALAPKNAPDWLGRVAMRAMSLKAVDLLDNDVAVETAPAARPMAPARPRLVVHEGGKAVSARPQSSSDAAQCRPGASWPVRATYSV